jgi:hypothetical protein
LASPSESQDPGTGEDLAILLLRGLGQLDFAHRAKLSPLNNALKLGSSIGTFSKVSNHTII